MFSQQKYCLKRARGLHLQGFYSVKGITITKWNEKYISAKTQVQVYEKNYMYVTSL